jgi:hypothetical protein
MTATKSSTPLVLSALTVFTFYTTFLFRKYLLPKFENSSARQDKTLLFVVEERRERVGASPKKKRIVILEQRFLADFET